MSAPPSSAASGSSDAVAMPGALSSGVSTLNYSSDDTAAFVDVREEATEDSQLAAYRSRAPLRPGHTERMPRIDASPRGAMTVGAAVQDLEARTRAASLPRSRASSTKRSASSVERPLHTEEVESPAGDEYPERKRAASGRLPQNA